VWPRAAHIPLFLYPFLNTVSKTRPFEYLRLTSLGVIGALVKVSRRPLLCLLPRLSPCTVSPSRTQRSPAMPARPAVVVDQQRGFRLPAGEGERRGRACDAHTQRPKRGAFPTPTRHPEGLISTRRAWTAAAQHTEPAGLQLLICARSLVG
jgi:hypothetical protein